MKVFQVKNFVEFHERIQRYDQKFTVCRGVSNASYELVPKIGRPDTKLRGKPTRQSRTYLINFRIDPSPNLSFTPRNDWEWIGLMQHHGALTRLLDWSRNPLVAAYFSVEKRGTSESAVYAWRSKDRPVSIKNEGSPFAINVVKKFIPAYISERIVARNGLFTVHPEPTVPMVSDTLEKIVILQDFRKEMKNILFKYGVHRAALFPGLDGLADHLTWRLHVESH